MKYPMVAGQIWAIAPEWMEMFLGDGTLALGAGQKATTKYRNISGGIAVVPVYGVITQKAGLFSEFLGETSIESMASMFDSIVADDSIGTVVLDVDSPGGSVYGVQEFADKVYAARAKKRIIAAANPFAASAALWIASQADEIYVTPSGEIGSIGVLAIHQEASGFEKSVGIKTTIIKAGKYKAEANPHEPLGDDARAAIQERVDDYYQAFIKAVARGRNVPISKVESDFGQGRMLGANQAVRTGLADGVMTIDGIIGVVLEKQAKRRAMAAKARMEKIILQKTRQGHDQP